MAGKISRTVSDWKTNFTKDNVQPLSGDTGDFLSAETVVLVAGPAKITGATSVNNLVPIGLVQNVQVSQSKQIQQMFEIGSKIPFFVPGRTVIQAAMSRVLFDGPSLMYAMYLRTNGNSGSKVLGIPTTYHPGGSPQIPSAPYEQGTSGSTVPLITSTEGTTGDYTVMDDMTTNSFPSKPGRFFINLASEFFNKPAGLGFVLYDMQQQPYGAFYLEECYIQSHTFSVSAQQTVLMENVSMRSNKILPLSVNDM